VINFKQFFESNKPLGLIETISFKELGPVEAKVDSGNGAYNVLHGVNLQYNDNKSNVTFDTVNDKTLTLPIKEFIDINIGSGNIEERPVVEFDIEIGDKVYPVTKFSIGDREENEYKILVGKDFIEQLGGLIDVSAEGNLD
tara:strand:+ start:945 stop:1367 length:423 start_codon:yes stop_codon:yes gene_type:complete